MATDIPQFSLLRLAAFLIDALTLALALVVPASIFSYTAVWIAQATKWVNIVWYGALLILVAGILLRDGHHGRSLGKRILGLELQTRDGKRCSYLRSCVRNLPLIVPGWNLLEVFLVVRGKPRTGDRIARTMVVEE